MTEGQTGVHTFLIADVRGYTRYTEEYGDEAAAELTKRFEQIVADGAEAYDGRVVEIRGDEALVVFQSARQAIRAAVDLQAQFNEPLDVDLELPLKVGIGVDSGEAVCLEDGSFRGSALNVAARLCGRAHGGEVLLSEATSRLAGRIAGLHYSDRGRVRLKNIPDPIRLFQVYSELDAPARSSRWIVMFFRGQRPELSWRLGLVVALIAAATSAGVVYLTAGDGGTAKTGSPSEANAGVGSSSANLRGVVTMQTIMPQQLWKDCKLLASPESNALQTAICVPASGTPDRWELSSFRSGAALEAAFNEELRAHYKGKRNAGRCSQLYWGGEGLWEHGPGKPGGRFFCYFDGNDAVMVWTHMKLGQSNHRDVLGIAREGGSDHVTLTKWWRPWHHVIGKAN